MKRLRMYFALAIMMCMCLGANARSSYYDDPGGGLYYANVYMAWSTDNESYGWCTGDSEYDAMGRFTGFSSENGGNFTTDRPGMMIRFRYHTSQSKDFNYKSTEYKVYALMADGTSIQIGHNNAGSVRLENDNTAYAVLVSPGFDGTWASFRIFLNQRAIDQGIKTIMISGTSSYHQDNFFTKDRDMKISYWYEKDVRTNYTRVPAPTITWDKPGEVQVLMDHTSIPLPDEDQYWRNLGTGNPQHRNGIGTLAGEYQYKGIYKVTVLGVDDRVIVPTQTLEYDGHDKKTVAIQVPMDKTFKVTVERSTAARMRINYWNGGGEEYATNWTITENLAGSETTTTTFNNDKLNVSVDFNQVTGDLRLGWDDQADPKEGDFQIYRTTVDENGNFKSNRMKLGTTSRQYYIDGLEQGLEYGKRYRYEVFQLKQVWSDINIPTDPEPLTILDASEVWVSTTPVIPLTLVQDATVTDKVKIDWEFGGIPASDNMVKFAVNRITPDGTLENNYGTVDVDRRAGKASFEDTRPASNCDIYRYFVTTDLVDNKIHYSSDTIAAHVLDGSVVTSVTISKGDFKTGVRLTWRAKQVGTLPTTYDVKRRFIGDDEWITIYTTQGTATEYVYLDESAEPGRYYEYRVTAYGADCDGTGNMVVSNYIEETGFGQATGVIAGRVTFETGTAVQNVQVMLDRTNDEQSTRDQFYSRRIYQGGLGVMWQPTLNYAQGLIAPEKAFTVQMWLSPDQTIRNASGSTVDYSKVLTLDGIGDLRLVPTETSGQYLLQWHMDSNEAPLIVAPDTVCAGIFSHVPLRHDGAGKYDMILNNESDVVSAEVSGDYAFTDHNGKAIIYFGGGDEDKIHGYSGYIDDVRLWSKALTNDEIARDRNRILSGREEGLKLYYPFDEGLTLYAYDNSYTNGAPNGNHPIINRNSLASTLIPTHDQLSLYGMTNANGEYIIRGIPFSGSGTGYTVRPVLGVHDFSPTSRTGFISANSLSLNGYDFTDVSSFTVSGTIRYSGTTVPVDSVMFFVDGTPCTRENKTIYSDANGEFTISVPIGEHYIEVKRNGHTFEGAGRYPQQEGERYDFRSETHLDFYDNTLVNFSGRVTGGAAQGSVPLGYGYSQNTIGKATIRLTMLDHPQRRINAIKQETGTTVEWIDNPERVDVPSAADAIHSTSWRGFNDPDEVKVVYITTDSLTGEFSAMLPPLRYAVESVKFDNNHGLETDEVFRNIPAINLTNPLDSVRPDTLWNELHTTYLPLYRCNKKLLLTYRSQPVFDVIQIGAAAGAFGSDTIMVGDDNDIALPIYHVDEGTGNVNYHYDYPLFLQHRNYRYKIKLYEPYHNYDRLAEGILYRDVMADSIISINNEMGNGVAVMANDTTIDGRTIYAGTIIEMQANQIQLDNKGEAIYEWTAGFPNLTAPYVRSMNIASVINGKSVNWLPNSLQGIVLGVVPTGNNFITAGPSYVDMVLRDPPGSGSSATWSVDTVKTAYTTKIHGLHQGTNIKFKYSTGFEVITSFGIGVASVTTAKILHDEIVTGGYELSSDWDNTRYTTYTNSHSVSTSSGGGYVGSDGDVFIGYSTNYIVGAANEVNLMLQDDGTYKLGNDRCMSMGEKFGTHFNYTQKYIEKTLIPNIKATRNSKFTHITDLSQMEENPVVPTYYTLLTEDNPNYGLSNDDEKWGDQANPTTEGPMPSYYFRTPKTYNGCDSVRWFNESIKLWRDQLSLNEQDKVEAFQNESKYLKRNESFEYGDVVNASSITDSLRRSNQTLKVKSTLVWNSLGGFNANGSGVSIESSISAGHNYVKNDVDEQKFKEVFSYKFDDTNSEEAHTVDIFTSPRSWGPIFRTRAGQTRCPYEPEQRTKYYEEGRHILNYGTMKLDNPKISMPQCNITDIPAGHDANIEVWLTNESETHSQYNVVKLAIDPVSNPNGLVVLFNGLPLAQGSDIWIPYGQTVKLTLTIRQSDPSVLDYNDLKLQLMSTCQANTAMDEVSFSAHFVPAAPAVTLKLNKNILNYKAYRDNDGIVATISDIYRQFTGFKGIRLKYRFIGDDNWIVAHDWVNGDQYLDEGEETEFQSLIPSETPNINYTLQLPNIDGRYLVVAESYCTNGVVNVTPELEIIRDTRGPKLLGQVEPNTGIFTPADNIHLRFNEDIRESYLTKDDNFVITGVLNDAPVDHEVSLQLNGNEVSTEAYLPINDTDFSLSFWMKRQSGGTVLCHGTNDNFMALKVTDDGSAMLDMTGETFTSSETIPVDKWVFVGMTYKHGASPVINAFYAIEDEVVPLFDNIIVPPYVGEGRVSVGDGFHGAMHQLSIWKKLLTREEILENKMNNIPPYTPGIISYWKMNEGHGTVVRDYARSRNMIMETEQWNIDNVNLAAHLDGQTSLKADISRMDSRSTDSYLIEMWFRGEPDANHEATLFSIVNNIWLGFNEAGGLEVRTFGQGPQSSLISEGTRYLLTDVNYSDGYWHHLAFNVRRGLSTIAYVDGKAVKTMAEQLIPAPQGDYLYIGSTKRKVDTEEVDARFFKGDIDELRVWSIAADATTVTSGRYAMVDTAKVVGLVGYFPMQRALLDANGNIIHEFSLVNKMLPSTALTPTHATPTQALTAPALKSAPDEQNIDFDFTASNDEIYITLRELPSRLHGNQINVRVKNVKDNCDNLSENISWSAVANYNSLEWEDNDIQFGVDRLNEYNFHTWIKNNSSTSTAFTISGAPRWVKVSPTEGTIGVNSDIRISFTIEAGSPVGKHDLIIYACDEDGIYTPLHVSLDIKGNEPSWSVDINNYESTMNVIGQFYLNDKIDQNSNTKVAAFINGECRGVASPRLLTSRGAYFVNMTIYGTEESVVPEPIVFKIYSGEEGVVYNNVTTIIGSLIRQLNFQPNALIGTYDEPVKWIVDDEIEQTIDFKKGWNWISFYVDPYVKPMGPEQAFGHDWAYERINSKNDGFSVCDSTEWIGTLTELHAGNMYKVRVNRDVTAHIQGTYIDPSVTSQQIVSGWNWIGPFSIYNLTISEAFADLDPVKGDYIKNKERISIYNGRFWDGTLTAIIPGEGYYYFNNGPDKTFRYPSGKGTENAPMRQPGQDQWYPFTPVDHHNFSDNMNVIAKVKFGDTLVDTVAIGAFIENQCRGVVRAINGTYFLTVAANADESGNQVDFRTLIDGQVLVANNPVTFTSDRLIGDLDNPYIITFGSSGVNDMAMMTASILVAPTLTSGNVNVMATAPLADVRVYSSGGALMKQVKANGNQSLTIDLSGYASGVYLVEVVTASGERHVERVVLSPTANN